MSARDQPTAKSNKTLTGKAPMPMPSAETLRGLSAEHIAKCREAMSKPAPLSALALVASGRVVVEVSHDGRDLLIDTFDGKPVRDEDHPECKMGLAGGWPLFGAGMIDLFGVVTPAGRALLAQSGEASR